MFIEEEADTAVSQQSEDDRFATATCRRVLGEPPPVVLNTM